MNLKRRSFSGGVCSFATLDMPAVSPFLCLWVDAEEERAVHYIHALCPADGSPSPHWAQVSHPWCFLHLFGLFLPPLSGSITAYRFSTCITPASIQGCVILEYGQAKSNPSSWSWHIVEQRWLWIFAPIWMSLSFHLGAEAGVLHCWGIHPFFGIMWYWCIKGKEETEISHRCVDSLSRWNESVKTTRSREQYISRC